MPTAFVTGATGFLGQHLVLQLLERGWEVHALKRPGSPLGALAGAQLSWVEGDLTDASSVEAALARPFDAVFHSAADTSVWRGDREHQTRVNVEGTRALLSAWEAQGTGCFIHSSSIAVWGLQSGRIDEETPRHEASVRRINYAQTKAQAEALVRESAARGRRAIILNPAHIMGPLDRHNWIRLLRLVARGRLPAIPAGSGSFADVREVARAQLEAVQKARPGVNYLLGGENLAFSEVIGAIAERLEVPLRARHVPGPVLRALARMADWGSRLTRRRPAMTPDEAAFVSVRQACDSSRARRELDYRITPFPRLLDDTLAWAMKEDML